MIPQAFTTRDMSEAYRWLHTLPPSVRDEMKSMEHVVSLYLKAKRMGVTVPSKEDLESLKAAPTPPPSISEPSKNSQEFQKTLKNLKTELDSFDFAPNSAPQNSKPEVQKPDQGVDPQPQVLDQSNPTSHNILSALRMDPRSRQIVNEIREGLNLSSDIEVLRMSLVLAHKTLRDLVK